MAARILCVSDKPRALNNLLYILKQDDYEIDEIINIEKASLMLQRNNYDLVLVDVNQTREACGALRLSSNVPIIALSDSVDEMDEILTIECGADDYIRKPINILKVKARVKASIRRSNIYSISGISFKAAGSTVRLGDRSIELSPKEGLLLHMLMERAGHAISRQELNKAVLGLGNESYALSEYIRRLRKKIEPDFNKPQYIISKYGVGYYFQQDGLTSQPIVSEGDD